MRLTDSRETTGRGRFLLPALVAAAAIAAMPARPVSAQSESPVGVRAAGMAGAFTAVADDATATFWNPAGLASGALAGLTLDRNALDRQSALFAGIVSPPLGLSYYREKLAPTSTAPGDNGRNGVVVHHAGMTLVQSLGDRNLAVGSTLALVHGNGATAFDADVGILASGSLASIGLTVHHLTAPSLGDVALQRRVRAGIAVNAAQKLTVAADVEFTRTAGPLGDWRDAAIGMEAHPQTRFWLRSGVHWNTAGRRGSAALPGQAGAAPIAAIGGSYTLFGSLRADAQASVGSKNGNRGWGAGLSFVY